MAEITLADVVRELKAQNELTKQTDKDIISVSQKLAQILADQAAQNRIDSEKAYEDSKRKNKESVRARSDNSGSSGANSLIDGFLKGSGLSSIGGFISSMFGSIFKTGGLLAGKLLGAIGFGLGKMAIWGVAGGLIVNYFSDEIRNWLDPDGNGKMELLGFKWDANSPLFWGGLSIAAGMIATSLVGFVGGQILALGATGLAALFMKIPGLKNIGAAMDEYAAKKSAFRQPNRPVSKTPDLKPQPITPKSAEAIKTPIQESNAKIGESLKRGGKLPEGYKITPSGKVQNAKGKFIGAEETAKVAKTLERPVSLSEKTFKLGGKALGAASKALNALMIVDFFLNPENIGFQNLSQSDMSSYEEAELEKIRKIFSKEGSAGIDQVLKYLNTEDPNLKDANGKALTIADMTGLKALVQMPRNDLIDIANRVRMDAIASGEQSISSTGQTVGIGSVSSARLLGQNGSIGVGSELNALDVLSEQRNNLSRLNAGAQMQPPNVVNSSSTVNNQQFESFYFGGGNSIDGNDSLMVGIK